MSSSLGSQPRRAPPHSSLIVQNARGTDCPDWVRPDFLELPPRSPTTITPSSALVKALSGLAKSVVATRTDFRSRGFFYAHSSSQKSLLLGHRVGPASFLKVIRDRVPMGMAPHPAWHHGA
jgi:hypothetical protein